MPPCLMKVISSVFTHQSHNHSQVRLTLLVMLLLTICISCISIYNFTTCCHRRKTIKFYVILAIFKMFNHKENDQVVYNCLSSSLCIMQLQIVSSIKYLMNSNCSATKRYTTNKCKAQRHSLALLKHARNIKCCLCIKWYKYIQICAHEPVQY